MGPTASGKTDVAVRLRAAYPLDIVSVDSALVYRHMDIGTAKPGAATLAAAPHRLIDIRDPEEPYSAGEFVADVRREIATIHEAGRIPLLAGGTMLYFRSLTEGIADLPAADADLRNRIDRESDEIGWPALHDRLLEIDPEFANRISPNDRQRIQRALEVHELSGVTMSAWHGETVAAADDFEFLKIALLPADRAALHARIERRLDAMFAAGFVDEVRSLMGRDGLTADHSSMRAVGYRQVWAHLEGESDLSSARYRALVATRQLAKRQLTWLRSEPQLRRFDPLESESYDAISNVLGKWLDE